jgi:hypothetical protein
MKKQILYLALRSLYASGPSEQMYELSLILDREPSPAAARRYYRILQDMVENARSKLD